jgi:hypothetical protein
VSAVTVVWEHTSLRLGDHCSYAKHCPFWPTWVVQQGLSHRLACWWHRPR